MSEYIIKGGRKVEGEVSISGSKNASLPIIAASILNQGKTTLYNVPNIHDTQMMYEILKKLGAIDDTFSLPRGGGRDYDGRLPRESLVGDGAFHSALFRRYSVALPLGRRDDLESCRDSARTAFVVVLCRLYRRCQPLLPANDVG